MYDSKVIANRLIDLARERGETLTPMQLIKLVYIAHGWMLGLYHRPLIRDEVQAWQYGPVIPRLYNAVRSYKGQPVEQEISCAAEDIDPRSEDIVSQVFDQYGHLSGPALSRLTHASGTPWDLTYEQGSFGVQIPDDLIEDHYAQLGARAD
jgi:uncharacterized phage-associated protein